MSEVQRVTVLWPVGPVGFGNQEAVLASDYDAKCHSAEVYFGSWKRTEEERDAAQSELAALREERNRLDSSLSCMSGHVLAYKLSRQRLLSRARARELLISDMQQRLTAAEQRNAELTAALQNLSALIGRPLNGPQATQDELLEIIWSATNKPTESGASE